MTTKRTAILGLILALPVAAFVWIILIPNPDNASDPRIDPITGGVNPPTTNGNNGTGTPNSNDPNGPPIAPPIDPLALSIPEGIPIPEGKGTLTGRIRGFENGQLSIVNLRRNVSIGPDGTFVIKGLPEGEAILMAQAPGIGARPIARLDVDPSRPMAIEFPTDEGVTISGSIQSENLITMASFTFFNADPSRPMKSMGSVRSRDGTFSISNLSPGRIVAHVTGTFEGGDRFETSATRTLQAGVTTNWSIPLPAGGISGRVTRLQDGSPIGQAMIEFALVGSSGTIPIPVRGVRSGKDGSYRATSLTPGTYRLVVRHKAYKHHVETITVETEMTPLDFTLAKGIAIPVQVTHNRKPIRGATVVLKDEYNLPLSQGITSRSGTVILLGHEGTFGLFVSAKGYETTQINHRVRPGKAVPATVEMEGPAATLSIQVVTSGNGPRPIAGATVLLKKNGTTLVPTLHTGDTAEFWYGRGDPITDLSGTYIRRDLIDGLYSYDVIHPNGAKKTGTIKITGGTSTPVIIHFKN